jgi:hypothetical protein
VEVFTLEGMAVLAMGPRAHVVALALQPFAPRGSAFSLRFVEALPTNTLPFPVVGVFTPEMTTAAGKTLPVCLPAFLKAQVKPVVVCLRHGLQVERVDAERVVARVVNVILSGDLSRRDLVEIPMNANLLALPNHDPIGKAAGLVSLADHIPQPLPAAVGKNPNALSKLLWYLHT